MVLEDGYVTWQDVGPDLPFLYLFNLLITHDLLFSTTPGQLKLPSPTRVGFQINKFIFFKLILIINFKYLSVNISRINSLLFLETKL